ncbi:MAG: hypothetical protein AAF683_11570 [Pseudomonadota bacterium]
MRTFAQLQESDALSAMRSSLENKITRAQRMAVSTGSTAAFLPLGEWPVPAVPEGL